MSTSFNMQQALQDLENDPDFTTLYNDREKDTILIEQIRLTLSHYKPKITISRAKLILVKLKKINPLPPKLPTGYKKLSTTINKGVPPTDEFFPKYLWQLVDFNTPFTFGVKTQLDPIIAQFYGTTKKREALAMLAAYIAKEIPFFTKQHRQDNKEEILWYNKEKNIYCENGHILIKRFIHKIFPDVSSYEVNEVINKVKAKTYKDPHLLDNPRYLVFQNKVLDRRNKEFLPPSKDFYATFALPAIYDRSKDCPENKKAFEIYVGKNKVHLLQEMFAFCLMEGYSIKEFLVLIGETNTGKSTFLRVLSKFLGNRVAGASIDQLTDQKFHTVGLVDKLANICADIPTTEILDSRIIKSITNEDRISVQRKHEQPFDTLILAKLIFSCNNFPHARDDSEAYIERLVFVDFIHQFTQDKKPMKEVIATLTTPDELSGLLNWALEGWDRLEKRMSFLTEEERKNRRKNYEAKTQPISYQIDNEYEFDETGWVFNEDLYEGHKVHCKKYNIEAWSRTKYIRMVKYLYKGKLREIKRPDPKNKKKYKRALGGIRLKGSATDVGVIAEIEETYNQV